MIKSICLSLALAVVMTASAQAQYGGGSGTDSSSGGYGGGGGKTAALVAAYAAAGGIVYAILLTRQSNVAGCLSDTPQGLQIVSDKDKKAYFVESPDVTLKPGTRVEIRGKKSKYGATKKFKAKKLVKEMGACEAPAATAAPAK